MAQSFERPQEEGPARPEDTLGSVASLGKDIAGYAEDLRLMLEIAAERGAGATLENDATLKKFEPTGEYELQLIRLRSELASLKVKLLEQGLQVTAEEMRQKRSGGDSGTASAGGQSPKSPDDHAGRGLGREKNELVYKFLSEGNYAGLLDIINSEPDKEMACRVIDMSKVDVNKGGHLEAVNGLLRTALSNLGAYGSALKELILYSWRNNLRGGRFWRNPDYRDETLFLDDDGEVISFKGETATYGSGDMQYMDYIRSLDSYMVLTGPNAGKTFSGRERPIIGPGFTPPARTAE